MSFVNAELTQLADVIRGITFPTNAKRREPAHGLIACLRTTNVQSTIEWDDLLYVDEGFVRNSDQFIQAGDILVSMSNSLDLVGKCALITDVPARATFGAFVAVVRAREGVDKNYLFHAMRSPAFRAYVREVASTTTNISNINASKLTAARIPVFGPQACERIANKINELFSRIEEGERALERVQKLVERYRQSVLKAAVTGELTREWREKRKDKLESGEVLLTRILTARREDWEKAELKKMNAKGIKPKDDTWKRKYKMPTAAKFGIDDLLPNSWAQPSLEQATRADRPIAYGVLQPGAEFADGVPMIRVCDVANGVIDQADLKKIAPKIANQFPRTLLQGGEVLLTLVGTIGRTAIVPRELAGANVARAVGVLTPVFTTIPAWLELCLRGRKARQLLTDNSREVARKTLNLEQLREFAVPMPCLEEQRQAISRVDELLSRANAAADAIARQVKYSSGLRQATLKSVFSGRLVHQNFADEPASVLLERISAKRSNMSDKSRLGKKTRRKHPNDYR